MHSEDATSAAADAEYRRRSTLNWEQAAAGWISERDRMRERMTPVTEWLVDHLDLRPGLTVLELAAGPGDPDPDASVDRVVCRFGYMLVPDRDAAFRETRRVLRPGGGLAFAVWAGRERNEWATTLWDVLESSTPLPPSRPGGPGMFALADRGVVEDVLTRAGLAPQAVEEIPVEWRYPSFEGYWRSAVAVNGGLTRLLPTLSETEQADLAAEVRGAIERFRVGDGYCLPGLALGVAARAPA